MEFRTPAGARAAGIAVVYQELSLIPSMSVADNMYLMREPSRFGIAQRRRIVSEARRFLEEHGFALDPQAIVQDLPYAYRQLTEIASALIGNIRILVLDEPTSSLSEGEEATLFDAIAEVTKRGVGVIYVTHRLGEVFRLSQRVTVLRDGLNVATHRTVDTDIASLVKEIIGGGAQGIGLGTAAGLGPHGEQPASREEVRLNDEDLELARAAQYRVGIALHEDSDWSRRQVAGITEELRRCGAVVAAVTDAGFDQSEQAQQLRELAASRPDAIVGIPVDQLATAEAFKGVTKSSIKLVLMDNAPQGMGAGEDYVSVVSADNYGLGQSAARLLSGHLEPDATAALIGLSRDFFATDQRAIAFRRWMEDNRPDVTIVEADFKHPSEAGRVGIDVLAAFPDLAGIFVVWDEPAMAVVANLRAQGRTIPVTTVDLGAAAAVELARGDIVKGIAAQLPFDQGQAEADAVILSLLDRPVPSWIALPGLSVTQASVIEAYEAVWHMPAPPALLEAHRDAALTPGGEPEAPVIPTEAGLEVPVVQLKSVHNDRLDGVDLSVHAGQIVGLAGMVGSGRTEIILTIFGLLPVTGGELLIDGSPVTISSPRDAIRRGMALVPEDRHVQGLVLEHSIERNLAMPRLPQLGHLGIFQRSASMARAHESMEVLSIKAPGPATPVRALSGGNQQKVVFGKWRDRHASDPPARRAYDRCRCRCSRPNLRGGPQHGPRWSRCDHRLLGAGGAGGAVRPDRDRGGWPGAHAGLPGRYP